MKDFGGNFVDSAWAGDLTALHRAERQSGTIRCYMPPQLQTQDFTTDPSILRAEEDAVVALTEAGRSLAITSRAEMIGLALMRSEAIASSFIEGLNTPPAQILRTELLRELDPQSSIERKPGAEIIGNMDALLGVTRQVTAGQPLRLDTILAVHRALMRYTPFAESSGRLRERQSWIGGLSPLHAKFVGPPASAVPDLVDDLLAFVNSRALPAITTAAIAHAQFESIHPFGDGNGRTGRALVHLILRQRQVGGPLLIPISQVIRANTDVYIRALESTRSQAGDPEWNTWREYFAATLEEAASRTSACDSELHLLADDWALELRESRSDSLVWRVLPALLGHPTVNSSWLQQEFACTAATADACLRTLETKGILKQVSAGRRNRVFEASAVLEILERL